jgi:predicted restriction endonuclease
MCWTAHITPFGGAHSDVLENGLLLRTDLHRLFDRNMFSFDGQKIVLGE